MPKPTFFNLPDDKRQRIADVALHAFAAQPFSKVSITRLVARAGIAKGSFYQYFDDKLDLYRWLLLDVIGARKFAFMQANMEAAGGGGFFAEVERMMVFGLEFGLAEPIASRVALLLRQDGAAGGPLEALYTELNGMAHKNCKALLAQGQQAGHVRADLDLDVGADLLMLASRELLDGALRRRIGVDLLTLCSRPELAADFTAEQRRAFVHEVVEVLQKGLGVADRANSPDDEPIIHINGLPETLGSKR